MFLRNDLTKNNTIVESATVMHVAFVHHAGFGNYHQCVKKLTYDPRTNYARPVGRWVATSDSPYSYDYVMQHATHSVLRDFTGGESFAPVGFEPVGMEGDWLA